MCLACAGVLALLADQYAYFKEQADNLQELQRQYQGRVAALDTATVQVLSQKESKKVQPIKRKKKRFVRRKRYRQTRRTRRRRARRHTRGVEHIVGQHIAENASVETDTEQAATHGDQQTNVQFAWPLKRGNFWISSRFGPRRVRGLANFHSGLDMAAVKGTPVRAAADGVALEAAASPGYGNTILLQHERHMKTRYAHLHRLKIKPGQSVKRGMIIGTVGNTGNVRANGNDGSHLHFEVIINNQPRNPLRYLS